MHILHTQPLAPDHHSILQALSAFSLNSIPQPFGSSYSNSSFPETYASLSKKPFTSAPCCKKSTFHPPCFTLLGVLLQAVRDFEQFVNKGKARHSEVHMPGSMQMRAIGQAPNGSDSCRQMPMTNGETTSKQPHARQSSNDSGKGLLFCCLNFESQVQESSGKAIISAPVTTLQ